MPKYNKNNITKIASSDMLRGTVVKLDSDANKVVAAGATDANAIGVLLDDVTSGDNVAVSLLGVDNHTVEVVASGAISVGEKVVLAASGKVSAVPAATSSAQTVYFVGIALTPAYADGNLIEILHRGAQTMTIAATSN